MIRSFATSFYDVKLAQTGLSLKEALELGYNADVVSMKAMYKNSGFEDSVPASAEIIYDKDKKNCSWRSNGWKGSSCSICRPDGYCY